jgi:hypothetical protein
MCQQVAGAGGDAVKRMAEVATALLQKDGIRGTTGGQKRRAEADLRTCVLTELRDVAAVQSASRALPPSKLLTGMSCSAGVGTAESGHLVPNRSPTSSSVLLVCTRCNRPSVFEHLP